MFRPSTVDTISEICDLDESLKRVEKGRFSTIVDYIQIRKSDIEKRAKMQSYLFLLADTLLAEEARSTKKSLT